MASSLALDKALLPTSSTALSTPFWEQSSKQLTKQISRQFSWKPFFQGQGPRGADSEGNFAGCRSVSEWRVSAAGRVAGARAGLQVLSRRTDCCSVSPTSGSSSSSVSWSSADFACKVCRGSAVVRRFRGRNGTSMGMEGRGRGRGDGVVMMALPPDAYWITAAQALGVAGLMGGIAIVTGILINIRIEVEALKEFKELEAKGQLPDEFIIPEGDDFDLEAPLYIFQNKQFSSANPTSRNRPVREEVELQPEIEVKTELEVAAKE